MHWRKLSRMPRISPEFAATIQQHHIALGKKAEVWVKRNIDMMEEEAKKKTKEIIDLEKSKAKSIAVLEERKKMLESKMPDGDEKAKQLKKITGQIRKTAKLFDETLRRKAEDLEKSKQEFGVYKDLIPRNNATRNQPVVQQQRRQPSAGKMEGMEVEDGVEDARPIKSNMGTAQSKKKWWNIC